jgi:hypothetical protein
VKINKDLSFLLPWSLIRLPTKKIFGDLKISVLMNLSIILHITFDKLVNLDTFRIFFNSPSFFRYLISKIYGTKVLRAKKAIEKYFWKYPQLVEKNTKENCAVSMDSYREVNCLAGERA